MIKKILLIVFISVQIILLSSCTHNKGGKYSEDLDEIIKRDTLRALTIYSSTSYFLYRGKAMG
ncbi:MAG: lytic transglycosylase F, partial [Bacteroidota bacterium]|nr:lytic transglycosylase F [Bacteroidota bacterium]